MKGEPRDVPVRRTFLGVTLSRGIGFQPMRQHGQDGHATKVYFVAAFGNSSILLNSTCEIPTAFCIDAISKIRLGISNPSRRRHSLR